MVRKFGKWQKGNPDLMSSSQMHKRFAIAGFGVQKPTAIETDTNKKRWRIYYKPIGVGEFWD